MQLAWVAWSNIEHLDCTQRNSRSSNLRQKPSWRHSPAVQLRWLMLTSLMVACGGSSQTVAVAPAARPKVVESAPPAPARPNNTLYRDEVESAKRAGLGHFFELVDLEPKGEVDGRGRLSGFQGFQVVTLRPATQWLSFDFAPGDILTHINGVSVEHYSTWFEQFEALSAADQIRVDLLRDGKPKTVIVKITDRSGSSAAGVTSQSAAKATQPPTMPSAAIPPK
jgi:hypothetical protein